MSTARPTLHVTPKQSDVLQELNRHWFVIQQVHQKTSIRGTVIPQHHTPVRKSGHVGTPSEAFFVFRYHLLNMLHHFALVKHGRQGRHWSTLADARNTKHCRCNRAKRHAWNCGLVMDETRGIVGHDQSATRVGRRKQCPPYWDRDRAEVPTLLSFITNIDCKNVDNPTL